MNFKIIGYIDLVIICCIFLWCAVICLKNRRFLIGREKEKNDKEIRQPKAYSYIGIICSILFLVLFAFCIWNIKDFEREKYLEEIVVLQFWFVLILIGVYILCISLNWRICLYKDYFTHTNFLGITHTYTYEEIKEKEFRSVSRYYKKGHYVFTVSYLQPNCNILSVALRDFKKNKLYRFPITYNKIDCQALRQKETLWLETASSNDKILYEDLVQKLKKEEDAEFFLSDLTVEVNDPMIFPVLEETLFQWEDKKAEAIVAYIIGDKNNKDSFEKLIKSYESLSQEERQRYSLLYDKALSNTITKESVLKKYEWLHDWRSINNLPKTIKKIAKWEIPEVNDIWLDVLARKNMYDNEYYQFKEAQITIEKVVMRDEKTPFR